MTALRAEVVRHLETVRGCHQDLMRARESDKGERRKRESEWVSQRARESPRFFVVFFCPSERSVSTIQGERDIRERGRRVGRRGNVARETTDIGDKCDLEFRAQSLGFRV